MKTEDIEKAAGEYSGSVLGFMDNPYVANNHKAFSDGARWRINTVWHDPIEEPDHYKQFVGENEMRTFFIDVKKRYSKVFLWKDYVKKSGIIRWAYLEDLTPDMEY